MHQCDVCKTQHNKNKLTELQDIYASDGVKDICDACRKELDDALDKMTKLYTTLLKQKRMFLVQRIIERLTP